MTPRLRYCFIPPISFTRLWASWVGLSVPAPLPTAHSPVLGLEQAGEPLSSRDPYEQICRWEPAPCHPLGAVPPDAAHPDAAVRALTVGLDRGERWAGPAECGRVCL